MKKSIVNIMCILVSIVSLLNIGCNGKKDSSSSSQGQSEVVYEATKSFSQTFTPQDANLRNCKLTNYGGSTNGMAIGYMDYSYSYAGYTVNVPENAYYAVSVRYRTDVLTKYNLYVNETNEYDLNFQGDGSSFKTTAVLVRLNKGDNTLKIRNVQGRGYSAVIDNVSVLGLKTPSQVAPLICDLVVNEGTSKLELINIDGFELSLSNSSNTKVVALNGDVTATDKEEKVKVRVEVKRNLITANKDINVTVKPKTPSASEIADEIYQSENGKRIVKGQTNIDIPMPYKNHEYFMVETSNSEVLNRNGIVVAKKEDTAVNVKYLVIKTDGTKAETQEITYIIEGLGYEYADTFINPLGNGQDPFSTYIDGYYYHIQAKHGGSQARLEMIRSTSFIDYKTEGFKTIYTFPNYSTQAWNCNEIWGPFPIMKWSDGHYYIYYAADDGDNNNHREGVLRSKTTDPMGEYEDLGMINTSDSEVNENPTVQNTRWAIGATTFQDDNGDYYLVWSGWRGINEGFPQCSYIAKIHSPTQIGARVELSYPTEDWEGVKERTPLQEGQAVFKVNGRYIMLYSANASWAGRYRLGMLVYEEKYEGGFLNADNWVKVKSPLFETSECVESPGGPCILPSNDGKEWWLLYHCSRWTGSGWTRYVCAKPIRFDDEGLPVLDDPLPFYVPMRTPSGDNYSQDDMDIIQAENGVLLGNARIEYSNVAVDGEYVCGFGKEGDSITFKYNAEKSGTYNILIRYAAFSEGTMQVLNVGEKYISLAYTYYNFGEFFTTEVNTVLQAGENILTIEHLQGCDVLIDFIGISYIGE